MAPDGGFSQYTPKTSSFVNWKAFKKEVGGTWPDGFEATARLWWAEYHLTIHNTFKLGLAYNRRSNWAPHSSAKNIKQRLKHTDSAKLDSCRQEKRLRCLFWGRVPPLKDWPRPCNRIFSSFASNADSGLSVFSIRWFCYVIFANIRISLRILEWFICPGWSC